MGCSTYPPYHLLTIVLTSDRQLDIRPYDVL